MTIEVQFLSMLASIGTGIWFGASFDTYQRISGKTRRFRWTQMVNDILFFMIQSLIFFYVVFLINFGEIRFYLLLALLLGFATYRALFERIYLKILEHFIRRVKQVFRISQRIIKIFIVNPLKWLLKVLLSLGMIVLGYFLQILKLLFQFVIFPISWLSNKYVQAYGIPFHSHYKKWRSIINKVKELIKRWFKKTH